MALFTAKDVNGIEFSFEMSTASMADLERVHQAERLPKDKKLAYFARREALYVKQRVDIVRRHHARLQETLSALCKRALGPLDDEVHEGLRQAARDLTSRLIVWKQKAKENAGDFNELNLANDLRAPLLELNQIIAPDLDDQQLAQLERTRNMVGDVLARAEAGVRAWIPGAVIKYRGSLATGWRNARKSQNGTAQRIDLQMFDTDAFIEVPAALWESWADMKIVMERERRGKMTLRELSFRVRYAQAPPHAAGIDIDAVKATLGARLKGIEVVEDQLRDAMESVPGYKLEVRENEIRADFGFVLQSAAKSDSELRAGNLYPLNEIARAGLPLTEARLALEFRDGKVEARMSERHVSMSAPVTGSTYPGEALPLPHTALRPTEAMLVRQFFNQIFGPIVY